VAESEQRSNTVTIETIDDEPHDLTSDVIPARAASKAGETGRRTMAMDRRCTAVERCNVALSR
jgi:hypothetical protein